jgi:WD repeat-containing protein 89
MSHTSPTLRLSPRFTKTSQTLATHSEGFTPGSGFGLGSQATTDGSSSSPYVLNIAKLPSHYAISTSAPANAIKVMDKRTLGFVASLGTSGSSSTSVAKAGKPGASATTGQAHEGGITSLKSYTRFLGENKGGLMSSGKDGRVVLWDERSPGGQGSLTSEYASIF